jgi:hypothetical protein
LESSLNVADEVSLENQNHEEARTKPVTLIFHLSHTAKFVNLQIIKALSTPDGAMMHLNFLQQPEKEQVLKSAERRVDNQYHLHVPIV